MLSKFDDFPIHQTAAPIAHPIGGDRNHYDRYWFNGYQDDGDFYFGIGAARYPNLGIFDCGFSIVHDGEQHSFHGSRRASLEPSDLSVGPFKIDVVEPMRRIHFSLADNDTGISADLMFTARTACVEEGRQTIARDSRLVLDLTRFAQFGNWEGEINYDGRTVAVDSKRVRGTKDRSWGVRPVAGLDPALAPEPRQAAQVFFLWAPLHWEDRCTTFGIFENEQGRKWHMDGAILPVYGSVDDIPGAEDPATIPLAAVEHNIKYASGTRRAESAEVSLVSETGEIEVITLTPMLCFQMKGIGYMHPEWGHGMWKGELAFAGESWKAADLDPMAFDNQHIQQVMRATSGNKVGIGVLEQLCFGPHAKYGFKGLLDGAK